MIYKYRNSTKPFNDLTHQKNGKLLTRFTPNKKQDLLKTYLIPSYKPLSETSFFPVLQKKTRLEHNPARHATKSLYPLLHFQKTKAKAQWGGTGSLHFAPQKSTRSPIHTYIHVTPHSTHVRRTLALNLTNKFTILIKARERRFYILARVYRAESSWRQRQQTLGGRETGNTRGAQLARTHAVRESLECARARTYVRAWSPIYIFAIIRRTLERTRTATSCLFSIKTTAGGRADGEASLWVDGYRAALIISTQRELKRARSCAAWYVWLIRSVGWRGFSVHTISGFM